MTAVEQRDPRTPAGEAPRGATSGRAGADDRDIEAIHYVTIR